MVVSVQQAREWIRAAQRVAALTGAGISAESGVPTFRGAGGLWRNWRPEDLATPQAFARDPKTVWEWYQWRRRLLAKVEPNPAHFALAQLERNTPGFWLITQNVDGLHDRAGSRKILKIHGDIWMVRCQVCGAEARDERLEFPEMPPRCRCGGLLRPGVVWFGEALPQDVWEAAEEAAAHCEVLLVVGASAVVYPAAGLIPLAKSAGAKVIEVNTEETPYSKQADLCLRGKAGELLPGLVE
jgi:NAD-dependent deacetylase